MCTTSRATTSSTISTMPRIEGGPAVNATISEWIGGDDRAPAGPLAHRAARSLTRGRLNRSSPAVSRPQLPLLTGKMLNPGSRGVPAPLDQHAPRPSRPASRVPVPSSGSPPRGNCTLRGAHGRPRLGRAQACATGDAGGNRGRQRTSMEPLPAAARHARLPRGRGGLARAPVRPARQAR